MTLVKWTPNRSLFNMANDLFDDFLRSESLIGRSRENWYPEVDIEETENDYIVSLDLPGMKKDDVKISFHDDILTISGEKKVEKKEEDNGNYHYFERRFGKFERSFRINSDIISDKIEATMKDGVLIVNLPKAEIAKPKQIEVKVK
jgi:HSP20 family protein